ncbi:MAG TPA: RagB/SusD family nutrient uptake outer membrane protein [Marinilabiliaceae bacterium]|nr:RagB/SusD family nutrient uptake outer membrane protein [Marinilabiliaceae bacterium]
MKSIKIYLIVTMGLVGMGLFSCSEGFLDVEPQTSLFDENFYATQADAELALIACYDGWQRTSSDGDVSFYLLSEVMSDQCFGGVGVGDDRNYQAIDRFDLSQAPAYSDLANNLWVSYYRGIFRCNKLLQELPNITWNGADEAAQLANRNRVEGETRVLRAILYFDMVRLFGNIPLLSEPTEANLPQANPDDVYALIAEDLLFGAENIPADAYPKANAAANDGRITPYAAKALLGRVYLYYTGYYGKSDLVGKVNAQQALGHLEDVIESNEYGLVSEYKDLWPASSIVVSIDEEGRRVQEAAGGYQRGNAETVLVKKFNYTQDYNGNVDGNRWLVMLGLRSYSTFPYGRGWGGCTVHPKVAAAFGNGDMRRSASIVDLAGEGLEAGFEKLDDQREYTGYTIKKFTPMSKWEEGEDGSLTLVDEVAGLGSGDFQTSQYQDWVLVRYADVLLMAAELGSANASTYLNMVRKRAYTSEGELGEGYIDAAPNLENILKERELEFAFEGIRYWDVMRLGIDKAAVIIAEENGVEVLSGNNADKVIIKADDFKEKKGLFQIPQTQITLSNYLLKQNAGW